MDEYGWVWECKLDYLKLPVVIASVLGLNILFEVHILVVTIKYELPFTKLPNDFKQMQSFNE